MLHYFFGHVYFLLSECGHPISAGIDSFRSLVNENGVLHYWNLSLYGVPKVHEEISSTSSCYLCPVIAFILPPTLLLLKGPALSIPHIVEGRRCDWRSNLSTRGFRRTGLCSWHFLDML
ncbi:hypothetical protein Tco_0654277 [Tanacetum coccineum]|uniref:Uncharacterized protein n=1 Tax=Tanacetum coccineum TaxID=301880 RepID=A0ABQ4X350_9ASTR